MRKFLWAGAALLVGAALTWSLPSSANVYPAQSCTYGDLDRHLYASGPCIMQDTTVHGNFAFVLTWPNQIKVTVEYVDAQGPAHNWRINGSSGMGFEVTREHLIGGTLGGHRGSSVVFGCELQRQPRTQR